MSSISISISSNYIIHNSNRDNPHKCIWSKLFECRRLTKLKAKLLTYKWFFFWGANDLGLQCQVLRGSQVQPAPTRLLHQSNSSTYRPSWPIFCQLFIWVETSHSVIRCALNPLWRLLCLSVCSAHGYSELCIGRKFHPVLLCHRVKMEQHSLHNLIAVDGQSTANHAEQSSWIYPDISSHSRPWDNHMTFHDQRDRASEATYYFNSNSSGDFLRWPSVQMFQQQRFSTKGCNAYQASDSRVLFRLSKADYHEADLFVHGCVAHPGRTPSMCCLQTFCRYDFISFTWIYLQSACADLN